MDERINYQVDLQVLKDKMEDIVDRQERIENRQRKAEINNERIATLTEQNIKIMDKFSENLDKSNETLIGISKSIAETSLISAQLTSSFNKLYNKVGDVEDSVHGIKTELNTIKEKAESNNYKDDIDKLSEKVNGDIDKRKIDPIAIITNSIRRVLEDIIVGGFALAVIYYAANSIK